MSEGRRAAGRRQYRSRREAERLAADFEASGLTFREFCERNPVSRSALARYVQRYRQPSTQSIERAAEARPRWVAVEVAASAPAPGASGLCVLLGGGRRIEVARGFDPATLRELVIALENY